MSGPGDAALFDPPDAREAAAPLRPRPVRPRAAASLVLVRQGPRGPEVLMGRRAASHRFMPNRIVFPGGRLDPADARAPALGALPPADDALLRRRLSAARARAAPLAAIRETWEETGVAVAARSSVGPAPEPWRPGFTDRGLAPALSRLSLLARAITPADRPIRFDAWFFLAAWEDLDDPAPPASTGELEDVGFVPLDPGMAGDVPAVTRFVLAEARARLTGPCAGAGCAVLKTARGRARVERWA